MKRGYARALADGAEIIVKLDADGQMDPRHIPRLIAPIVARRRPIMPRATASPRRG